MAMAAPLLAGVAAGGGSLAAGTTLFGSTMLAAGLSGLSAALPMMMGSQANNYDATAGQLSAGAAEMEATQLEMQAEHEKTRALQESTNRRQQLNQILNKQMSMTAGRGVAIGSGSDLAITSFSEQEFQEEDDIAMSDSRFRQQQLRNQATQARLGGRGSLLASSARQSQRTTTALINTAERINTGNVGKAFKTVFG